MQQGGRSPGVRTIPYLGDCSERGRMSPDPSHGRHSVVGVEVVEGDGRQIVEGLFQVH